MDADRCRRLSGAYATGHLWQVDESIEQDRIALVLSRIRIPRPLQVPYPGDVGDLLDHWKRRECFLVAEDAGSVAGFLDVTVDHDSWEAWVQHLIVHPPYRRQGVAMMLLEGAEQWTRGSRLRSLTAALQPKNDPAIQLFAKRNYTFRGLIDRYFGNGDVALLYGRVFSYEP
ncbi:MAG: GNAT family N-acetyltransferase [Anaerolineae bacterium]|nr:GNAT family N-acetyltransferase [Anaerolineae bacterium]